MGHCTNRVPWVSDFPRQLMAPLYAEDAMSLYQNLGEYVKSLK